MTCVVEVVFNESRKKTCAAKKKRKHCLTLCDEANETEATCRKIAASKNKAVANRIDCVTSGRRNR